MLDKIFRKGPFKDILIIFMIAMIGTSLFHISHLPVPWLLGPIFSLTLFQFLYKKLLLWPVFLRDLGLVVLGLTIGQQFNLSLFHNLGITLVYMFILNVILILGSIGIAYLLSKWSKLSLKTLILSTIPGGLSQIIIYAEEEKDVNLAVVTYFQVIRLLLIVF